MVVGLKKYVKEREHWLASDLRGTYWCVVAIQERSAFRPIVLSAPVLLSFQLCMIFWLIKLFKSRFFLFKSSQRTRRLLTMVAETSQGGRTIRKTHIQEKFRSLLTSKYPLLLNMASQCTFSFSKMLSSFLLRSFLLPSSFPSVFSRLLSRVSSNALLLRHIIFGDSTEIILHCLVLPSCILAGPELSLLDLDTKFSPKEAGLLQLHSLYYFRLCSLHPFSRIALRLRQDERPSTDPFWPRNPYIA